MFCHSAGVEVLVAGEESQHLTSPVTFTERWLVYSQTTHEAEHKRHLCFQFWSSLKTCWIVGASCSFPTSSFQGFWERDWKSVWYNWCSWFSEVLSSGSRPKESTLLSLIKPVETLSAHLRLTVEDEVLWLLAVLSLSSYFWLSLSGAALLWL